MSVSHTSDLDLLQRCIDNCAECQAICEDTLAVTTDEKRRTILVDCAQMCGVNVEFMKRESELHPFTCFTCAEACRRCAEEWEGFSGENELLARCADACRRCEVSCRAMSIKVNEIASVPLGGSYPPPRPEEEPIPATG